MTNSKPAALPLRDNRYYGRRADLPDPRDHRFDYVHELLLRSPVPSEMDLRTIGLKVPTPYDQGQLGSCVGNGVAFAYDWAHMKQGRAGYKPSRLAIYYWARLIEGSVASDSGCEIRDGIKAAAKLGAPHESIWPYKISRFANKPSPRAYTDGAKHEAITYARVDNDGTARELQAAIAGGLPVVIGITVFESFESAAVERTGVVPMPALQEQVLGGHCMVAVGYDRKGPAGSVRFIVRNSWGSSWGDAGYCYMPAAYLIDVSLASDFWVLQAVS